MSCAFLMIRSILFDRPFCPILQSREQAPTCCNTGLLWIYKSFEHWHMKNWMDFQAVRYIQKIDITIHYLEYFIGSNLFGHEFMMQPLWHHKVDVWRPNCCPKQVFDFHMTTICHFWANSKLLCTMQIVCFCKENLLNFSKLEWASNASVWPNWGGLSIKLNSPIWAKNLLLGSPVPILGSKPSSWIPKV